MLGNFHDNVINIECETNSADLYVVDAEGVYIENIAMHSYLESDVIDAINAKYGKNFTHLTMQKVTGIAIGDDCPNWDAYEKINGFWGKFAVGANGQNTSNFICTIEGHSALFQTKNNQMPFVSEKGKITGFGPGIQGTAEWCLSKIKAEYDITIISIDAEEVLWNVGDEIEEWNSYIKISY